MKRRQFISTGILGSFAVVSGAPGMTGIERAVGSPLVISTWKHGLAANEAAMEILPRVHVSTPWKPVNASPKPILILCQ